MMLRLLLWVNLEKISSLSPAARKLIPYSFECKNQEKLSIWSSLEQAAENSGDYPPVLIFKRNRSKTYVTIELEEFIKLINDQII